MHFEDNYRTSPSENFQMQLFFKHSGSPIPPAIQPNSWAAIKKEGDMGVSMSAQEHKGD